MLRAEREDEIRVEGYGLYTVIRRDETYYGPKLRLEPRHGEEQRLLHAPGPDEELQLSSSIGAPLSRVYAALESVKQYDICPRCGEPVKTAWHCRMMLLGTCEGEAEPDGGEVA